MSNWTYAAETPTEAFRGAMTLPREYSLREVDGEVRLIQNPVEQLRDYRRAHVAADDVAIGQGTINAPMDGDTIEIKAVFDTNGSSAEEFGIKVRVGDGEETLVGYDVAAGEVFVDRTESGQIPNPVFAAKHAAPLEILPDGTIKLHVFVDKASVELFANGGLRAITDQIFPDPESTGVELYAEGAGIRLKSLDIWEISTKDTGGGRPPRKQIGTKEDDILSVPDGVEGRPVLRGLDGDDVLIGSARGDLLLGCAGNDILRPGGGKKDVLLGGAGDDLFDLGDVVGNGTRDKTIIRDFEAGRDSLDLGGAAEVSVRERGGDLLIRFGEDGDRVVLAGAQHFQDDWIV